MILPRLPDGFASHCDAHHQLAYFVLSPLRYRATGRMGLVSTPGGFGTPEFDGRVVRVEGGMIMDSSGDASATRPITTLADAAGFVGIEYDEDWFTDFGDPLEPIGANVPLHIDAGATDIMGALFAFAWAALAEVKEGLGGTGAPSETQLWPEHFDAAAEVGDDAAGSRASLGLSPGDAGHPEPYLYVSPWSKERARGDYWNDDIFGGASLPYARLLESADPHREAVRFLRTGVQLLADPA